MDERNPMNCISEFGFDDVQRGVNMRRMKILAALKTAFGAPIGSFMKKEQRGKNLLSAIALKCARTAIHSTTRNMASFLSQSSHIKEEKPFLRSKSPSEIHLVAFAFRIGFLLISWCQSFLAGSMAPLAYQNNPGFLRFISESGLQFHAFEGFSRQDLDARSELYQAIANRLWNPENLLKGLEQ